MSINPKHSLQCVHLLKKQKRIDKPKKPTDKVIIVNSRMLVLH